jgi:hypothetical protein
MREDQLPSCAVQALGKLRVVGGKKFLARIAIFRLT